MALQPGQVRLHNVNIGKVLKSEEFAALATEVAHKIAEATGVPEAEVQPYTTDRKAAGVVVPAEEQAVNGVLTRAAASLGLTVVQK